jgi:hypothetical protein
MSFLIFGLINLIQGSADASIKAQRIELCLLQSQGNQSLMYGVIFGGAAAALAGAASLIYLRKGKTAQLDINSIKEPEMRKESDLNTFEHENELFDSSENRNPLYEHDMEEAI